MKVYVLLGRPAYYEKLKNLFDGVFSSVAGANEYMHSQGFHDCEFNFEDGETESYYSHDGEHNNVEFYLIETQII